MPDQLLALSFLQPWLWAIVEGHKGVSVGGAYLAIENRKWRAVRIHRERTLALHASAGYDNDGNVFVHKLVDTRLDLRQVPRGAIVATARIVGAVELREPGRASAGAYSVDGMISDEVVRAVLASPWTFGPWAWVLSNVQKLPEPIPCKGALGFWRVPPDIATSVYAHVPALGAAP